MKPTKNILITTSTYPRWTGDSTPGFVEQFAHSIAPNFAKVHVLAPHSKGAKRRESKANIHTKRYRYFYPPALQDITYGGGGVYKIKKTPLYALKLLGLLTSLFLNTLFTSIFKRIDTINAHWIIPQGFTAILVKFLTGKQVIVTVHGSDIHSLTGGVMTSIKRFTLKHSDQVVVNSTDTKLACQKVYDRDYQVIPMGINPEQFKPVDKSAQLVSRHNLDSFTILFVGRLAEVKGVMYLCQALSQLHQAGYDFQALIVGDGPLREELEQYVHDNNLDRKVVFCGWVDSGELNDYYSVADVFVGPSLREAQGLVFVEALATGTPVIASKVGGIPGIVKDNVNGYLVPVQSSTPIYDGLRSLIGNPSKQAEFSQQARQYVLDEFSWDSISAQYIKVFDGESSK